MLISVALTRTVTSAVSLIIVAVNDEAKVAAAHNAAQIAAVHNAGQTAAVHNAPHTVAVHNAPQTVAVHNAPQTAAQSPVGTKSFRSGIRLPVRGTATAVATHDAAPTIAPHFDDVGVDAALRVLERNGLVNPVARMRPIAVLH